MSQTNVELLEWCESVVGPFELLSGDLRGHGRASVCRLQTRQGFCYLKIHRDPYYFSCEVHGYQAWAGAFGLHCPELLAVHAGEPLAILVSELPGQIMNLRSLSPAQELAAWRMAGQKLALLHEWAAGDFFGPCQPDGQPLGEWFDDAERYVDHELDDWIERGLQAQCLQPNEIAIVSATRELLPAFAGERPVACHRDYCPVNWLVDGKGVWAGVIDFEFAYWDVRVADFSRYPDWEWIERPELINAFFEGYGRPLTPREEEQRLVAQVQYALSAIVWGREAEFYPFEGQGRAALELLADKI